MIEIERGSEAWHAIGNAILTGYKLRIAEHDNTEGWETVKVKRDEDMWTPPLSVRCFI